MPYACYDCHKAPLALDDINVVDDLYVCRDCFAASYAGRVRRTSKTVWLTGGEVVRASRRARGAP